MRAPAPARARRPFTHPLCSMKKIHLFSEPGKRPTNPLHILCFIMFYIQNQRPRAPVRNPRPRATPPHPGAGSRAPNPTPAPGPPLPTPAHTPSARPVRPRFPILGVGGARLVCCSARRTPEYLCVFRASFPALPRTSCPPYRCVRPAASCPRYARGCIKLHPRNVQSENRFKMLTFARGTA